MGLLGQPACVWSLSLAQSVALGTANRRRGPEADWPCSCMPRRYRQRGFVSCGSSIPRSAENAGCSSISSTRSRVLRRSPWTLSLGPLVRRRSRPHRKRSTDSRTSAKLWASLGDNVFVDRAVTVATGAPHVLARRVTCESVRFCDPGGQYRALWWNRMSPTK